MPNEISNANGAVLDVNDTVSLKQHWVRCCFLLRAKLGDDIFNSWFGRIELEAVAGGQVRLSVATRFLKSWIDAHYLGIITAALTAEFDEPVRIRVVVRDRTTIPKSVAKHEGARTQTSPPQELVYERDKDTSSSEVEETVVATSNRTRAHEPKRVKIEGIQKLVATHYSVLRDDMNSSTRRAAVVKPRQVAMFLARNLTGRSLPEIGRRFGGRDHTTVLHAVRKIETLSQTDGALRDEIDLLKRMLQG